MNPALSNSDKDVVRKGGVKRPALYLAIFFSVGILAARSFNLPLILVFLLALCSALLAIIFSRIKTVSHLGIYLAALFLGIAFYQNSNILPSDHISVLASDGPKKIFVRGVIAGDPVAGVSFYGTDKATFNLDVISCKDALEWNKASGIIKVVSYSKNAKLFRYGDEVILEGLISKITSLKNPGLFDYSAYMAIKGIYASLKTKEGFVCERTGRARIGIIRKAAYALHNKINSYLDKYLTEPHNGFLKAILVGDRTDLGEEIEEDFVKTGTVHILAISGLNIALIAAVILAFFGVLRVPKKLNLIFTVLFLVVYAFAAGSNPPVVRAVIMFFILVAGYLINRDADVLNSLAVAALAILLHNPKELFDPSFQLSFVSLGSIIIFGPKIDGVFGIGDIRPDTFISKARLYILKGISVSISAWVGTWPVIVAYFNIVSPISILANLIAVPALFLLTVAAFAFLLMAGISGFMAAMLAEGLTAIDAALFSVNRYLAGLPFSYLRIGNLPAGLIISYYALISLLLMPKELSLGRSKVRRKYLLMALLIAANFFVWKGNAGDGRESLQVTFLDVGRGDSAFIELPKKGNILIDGGSGGEEGRFDVGEAVVAPYLWSKGITNIDAVIVTHYHEDHLGGIIYILKNFKVGCVIDNGVLPGGGKLYNEYLRAIKDSGVSHLVVGEGDAIDFSGSAVFLVLNPEKAEGLQDSNENSIVMKFLYKGSSILFCADVAGRSIERLNSYGEILRSDVMKAPHHGGKVGDDATVETFFRNISPKVCVVSSGIAHDQKSSSGGMSKYITHLNTRIYDTKDVGAVTLLLDSKHIFVRTAKMNKN